LYIDVEKKRRLPRGRFVAFIRALHREDKIKGKLKRKKGGKKLLADAAFYSSSSVLLRLKPLAQRDDLSYHLHVVYPGRYNYFCGSVPVSLYLWREGLNSKAKRRDMDRLAAAAFSALWS
jgi:hypothetical protein